MARLTYYKDVDHPQNLPRLTRYVAAIEKGPDSQVTIKRLGFETVDLNVTASDGQAVLLQEVCTASLWCVKEEQHRNELPPRSTPSGRQHLQPSVRLGSVKHWIGPSHPSELPAAQCSCGGRRSGNHASSCAARRSPIKPAK
jgi:hypothetical protein